MPTNSLTDAKCRAAKAAEKAYKLFDGGGLHLYVSPLGAKVWRLAYRLAGKPKTMSFGPYPDVSLAVAREKRDQAKATLRDGGDPMAPRKAQRKGLTLLEASETYWTGRKDITDDYRRNARNGIEQHLGKELGKRNIGSITRDELLAELLKMDEKGLHTYVRTVRMWVGQVFEWAVERGDATINPAALIRPEKAFGKKSVQHFAALDVRDVPELMRRLRFEGELQSVLACRLMAFTGARTVELRTMRWEHLDEAEALWLLPAFVMKHKKEHVVPLSRQAMIILREMKNRARGPYVFPNDHRPMEAMSENAVLYLLHRIGYKGVMTGHGWRSIISTWANKQGFNPDAIERLLAHVPGDKVRAVYNRWEYLPERQQILQAWGDWLESCEAKI
jgi:integrase